MSESLNIGPNPNDPLVKICLEGLLEVGIYFEERGLFEI